MSTEAMPLIQRCEGAVLIFSNNNPAARNALSVALLRSAD